MSEAVVIPKNFCNIENWKDFTMVEVGKIEQFCKKMIHQVFHISRSLPYRGVLNAAESCPCVKIVSYKR